MSFKDKFRECVELVRTAPDINDDVRKALISSVMDVSLMLVHSSADEDSRTYPELCETLNEMRDEGLLTFSSVEDIIEQFKYFGKTLAVTASRSREKAEAAMSEAKEFNEMDGPDKKRMLDSLLYTDGNRSEPLDIQHCLAKLNDFYCDYVKLLGEVADFMRSHRAAIMALNITWIVCATERDQNIFVAQAGVPSETMSCIGDDLSLLERLLLAATGDNE